MTLFRGLGLWMTNGFTIDTLFLQYLFHVLGKNDRI